MNNFRINASNIKITSKCAGKLPWYATAIAITRNVLTYSKKYGTFCSAGNKFFHNTHPSSLNRTYKTRPHALTAGGTSWQLKTYYQEHNSESQVSNVRHITHEGMDQDMTFIRSVNDYAISAYQEFFKATGSDSPSEVELYAYKAFNYSVVDEVISDFLKVTKFDVISDKALKTSEYEKDWTIDQEVSLYQRVITLQNGLNIFCVEFIFSNTDCVIIYVGNQKVESVINFLTETVKKYNNIETIKDNTFFTISSGTYGFELTSMVIKKQDIDYIETLDNYNDDFVEADRVIKEAIESNQKGLMLLHGIPGSGKTSYIKHLITYGPKRKIVYVPTHLAGAIANPEFMGFVKDNLTNCVLVIEDAEQVLLSREDADSHKAAVSNLLNMTDGILADALNILIIATFNTDTDNIDQALMRKGRLLLSYKFDKLTKEKTNILTNKLFGRNVNESMTLAEIYNLEYDLIKPEEKKKHKIGFI